MRSFIACTILDFSWDKFWNFLEINPTVVSGLLGVLIGGTITLYVTRLFYKKKRQDDVSFKLVDQYFEKFDEIAQVKGLLELGKEKSYKYCAAQINRIKKLGNWCNFAKGLENEEMTNNEILRNMPLENEIKKFVKYIDEGTKNKEYEQSDDFIKIKEDCKFLFNTKGSWEWNRNIFNRKVKILVECNNERKEQTEQKD